MHNAEHLAFLLVGYLFWRQIFGNDPNAHRLHPALQFFYLFMAIPIDTFTGLSLAGATHEIFPAYFATHRTWGPSYVTDLHVGGDIMWVVGDTLMLWPMIPVALRWMHMDERRAVRDRPRARRAGGRPKQPRRARCPITRRGPSAPLAPRRDRCSRRISSAVSAEVDAWCGSTRRRHHRARRSGPPCPPRRAPGRTGGSARAG